MEHLFKKRLLPAVTLPDKEAALRVAESFLEAGLHVMEVTFRTEVTASAITAIARRFPEIHVGAGTILTPEQVKRAVDAGAEFGLAPGYNPGVADQARALDFPFIPGVLTPSEIEQAYSSGFKVLKLFPIQTVGGADYIQKLNGPYGHTNLKYIPMGGVNAGNMASFMQHDSVLAAGGSWLCPSTMIADKAYGEVTRIVRESLQCV